MLFRLAWTGRGDSGHWRRSEDSSDDIVSWPDVCSQANPNDNTLYINTLDTQYMNPQKDTRRVVSLCDIFRGRRILQTVPSVQCATKFRTNRGSHLEPHWAHTSRFCHRRLTMTRCR